jgi:hypothetical protein
MMNPQTREQDFGGLYIEPDINHTPYPEDMEDIAYVMYDPQMGLKMISMYMQQAYEYYGQVDDLKGENGRIRQRMEQLTESTPEEVGKLKRDINDLKEANARLVRIEKTATEQLKDTRRDFMLIGKENQEIGLKCSDTIHEVFDALEGMVRGMAKHMSEPGMRDIDELWIEESKTMAMVVLNKLDTLKKEKTI